MDGLRQRVVSGMTWATLERVLAVLVSLVTGILVARIVDVDDFGRVAMLALLVVISYTIVDGGFTQALIRKQDATRQDFSSVLFLNLLIAALLYGLFWVVSVPIAEFYSEPELTRFAPFVFLALPLNALTLVQTTVMQKQYRFKALSVIGMISVLLSSGTAIYMAYTGWGIWTLIFMPLTLNFVKVVLLWSRSRWLPLIRFRMAPIREFWSLSSNVAINNFLNSAFNNLPQVLIGKFHQKTQLGLYNQALKYKDTPLSSLTTAISSVVFPTFSSLHDDRERLANASRKALIILSFLIFPISAGLIVCAPEGFTLLLTEKWDGAIPYFQIFCLTGFLIPALEINYNILRIKAPGKSILRIALLRKTFMLIVVVVAVMISVRALVWAYVIYTAFDVVAYILYAKRFTNYTITRQFRDLFPYFAASVVMFLITYFAGILLAPYLSLAWLLGVKIVLGVSCYVVIAKLFRFSGWDETMEIIRGYFKK